ncbi:MAG: hypothetical protein CME70_12080 [Halobacteriovorax sp.]|nr:hypothetical protein [Halobacteriovorax sp.]|tara:strand:+ start:300939 stop:302324 length:1386 start_codon:yes stop_codon:yes gene_type:complete
MINFENTYSNLPEEFYEKADPASFPKASLLAFNYKLAEELGIDVSSKSEAQLAMIFSGQEILEGSEPLAMAYAGHQFGHFVPQLGDGRALLLGETKGFDIQLKGGGRTFFSRGGDGKSALGPVIREYILSEAMHQLKVPTTRALAAVLTNEPVYRQEAEPGGVFTRVAKSHLRVGTFQFFASRQDHKNLKVLMDYAIKRHYPKATSPIEFLVEVAKAQAELTAIWTSLGFIHGVMNTDNSSIAGITIDYGPCAFMDEYKAQKVFSSIDRNGRYAFMNQGPITQWNILRLAECLIPLIDPDENKAVSKIEESLKFLPGLIQEKIEEKFSEKLGLPDSNRILNHLFLSYLEENQLDFTLSFRNLPELFNGDSKGYPDTEKLQRFLSEWRPVAKTKELHSINPLYIPRNHQVQRVIDDIYKGQLDSFKNMNKVLENPYSFNQELDHFKEPPTNEQRVTETFCGT